MLLQRKEWPNGPRGRSTSSPGRWWHRQPFTSFRIIVISLLMPSSPLSVFPLFLRWCSPSNASLLPLHTSSLTMYHTLSSNIFHRTRSGLCTIITHARVFNLHLGHRSSFSVDDEPLLHSSFRLASHFASSFRKLWLNVTRFNFFLSDHCHQSKIF